MGQIIRGGEQFETHIEADHRGQVLAKGPDSGAVDAFGRTRISEPFTLFDSTLRHSDDARKWKEIITASGTSSHLINESSVAMSVTASGDSVLRRTRQRFPYQPGKGMLVLQSFAGGTLQAGVVQEIGLFDDNNGVMLRASGTTVQFVIRSYTSGSPVETVVNQSDWNIDTAPWLDFTKANIFSADLEWLGVGRVRVGFVKDGEHYYCHEFNHANALDKVYMTTAILPLSYNIETTASTPATMKHICSSVMSEGGYEPSGPIYLGGRGVDTFAAISSETMVAAIRMASGRTDNVILPAQIDLTLGGNPGSNVVAQWRLRLNPTISGTWAAAQNGRGNVETMASGTFSGGTIVGGGLVAGRSDVEFNPESGLALSLGTNAAGESDILALTIQCSSSQEATGLIGWREVV
jgi:hypothetical protein